MKLFILFDYLSLASTVAVLVFAFFQWKWLEGDFRLLFWAVIASVLSDVISALLSINNINTWSVGNVFIIVHFALLFVLLGEQRRVAVLKVFFYACFVFSVINYFFIQSPLTFNSYTAYASGILMIISAISFLYQIMNTTPVEKVQTLPMLWLAFGVLVYYGGTLFLFLFNNYLIAHLPENHQSIWVLHNLINITKNVFFFITIWVNYKSKTSPL